MQEYPVKKECVKNLKDSLERQLRETFEVEPVQQGDHYTIRFGALSLLDVTIGPDGKSIIVMTESDRDVSDEVVLDTNRRFRRYLDNVTGYSTKERVKKAKSLGAKT